MTATAVAVRAKQGRAQRQMSRDAATLFSDLMALEPTIRHEFVLGLDGDLQRELFRVATHEGGTPYALYVDDPVGFTEQILGEALWSKSEQLMAAIPAHTQVAVPSCFGSSKTHSAGRVALWWSMVYPVGTARVVTIAPLWRQVVRQMWPEIRAAHHRAGLPGQVDIAQMKQRNKDGLEVVTAYGLSASPYNEAAVQGIHSPNLLLVVDEAGGIGHTVGRNLRALLTGSNSRMLAIGNPPTDNEGSWFEGLCQGEASHDVKVIAIPASSTPNLSGERAPRCRTCPSEVPAHTLAKHLVDRKWVADTIAEHGADAPYVIAKVNAAFPKGGSSRILPHAWLAAARDAPEPDPAGHVRLNTIEGETEPSLVRAGAWVRLGVDVAADGGDELTISRAVGDLLTLQHASAGEVNANAVDVAGVILEHIRQAERVRRALGTAARVRVKIDANGIGWGVGSTLEAWGTEGIHDAEIVRVMVSESTNREVEPTAVFRPALKRDEMWVGFRKLIQPPPLPEHAPANTDVREYGYLRLRVDDRYLAQLAGPKYGTSSSGLTVIESKKRMKARGLTSPDRGESGLLAFYEPAPDIVRGHGFRFIT